MANNFDFEDEMRSAWQQAEIIYMAPIWERMSNALKENFLNKEVRLLYDRTFKAADHHGSTSVVGVFRGCTSDVEMDRRDKGFIIHLQRAEFRNASDRKLRGQSELHIHLCNFRSFETP